MLVRCWVNDRVLYIDHAAYGVGIDIGGTPALFDRVPGARQWMIRADGSWPQTLEAVAKLGFNITAAPKWSGSVEDGAAHLRAYDRIVIHARCKRLAEEARLWRRKIDELSGEVMRQFVSGNDHGWDGVRYALSPLIVHQPTAWLA